jgi:hypothetical protein
LFTISGYCHNDLVSGGNVMLMNNYLTAPVNEPFLRLLDFGMATPVIGWDYSDSCTHIDIISAMLIFDGTELFPLIF